MCAMDLLTCNSGATNSESQVGSAALDSDVELSHVTFNSDGLLFSESSPSSEVLICNGEADAEYHQPNKRRRKSSEVWEFFTVQAVDANHCRAFCKYCRRSFSYINGSKSVGTSHLKRHIKSAVCPAGRLFLGSGGQLPEWTLKPKIEGSPDVPRNPKKRNRTAQKSKAIDLAANHGSLDNVVDQPKKRKKTVRKAATGYFNEDRCIQDMAKMIIQHGYPLEMVAHSGFNNFVRSLQPQYKVGSVNTIEEHIIGIYTREKHNVVSLLAEIPGRVNFSLDSWYSDENKCYLVLTAHFIDSYWKLHHRILKATIMPFPDSEAAYIQAVSSCLTDWNIDDKLFALTLNQYLDGDTVRGNFRGLLSIKNPAILNGQLVVSSCYARALSAVAGEALELMKETVEKIRQNVRYVVTSHKDKFDYFRQQLQLPSTRDLDNDDRTKWNTTYEMLDAACDLKEVWFYLGGLVNISIEEWSQVNTLRSYLKLLYDAAGILTAESIPTANAIFHDVWGIQAELAKGSVSQDTFIRNLTTPLKQKFDRYWQECGLVSAVAVIMDPRFKMKLIEFCIPKIPGEDAVAWTKVLVEGLHELFNDYVVRSLPDPKFVENTSEHLSGYEIYITEFMNSPPSMFELDQYLEEPLLPRIQSFDVLGWWKDNRGKYPVLAKMASDILSISFSTVYDKDSVFDLSKKSLEGHWRTLTPEMFEAIVCAKDWLQHESETSTSIIRI